MLEEWNKSKNKLEETYDNIAEGVKEVKFHGMRREKNH